MHSVQHMRKFVTPRELKAQFDEQITGISNPDFIRKPQNQHLKDCWCAIHFGIGYERHVAPCALWVNPEQNSDTDFVLSTNRGEFLFQTTLSDIPERKMGGDYKVAADGKLPVRHYEPSRGSCDGPKWIAEAVQKKVSVNYAAASNLNLLVYANFPTNGLDYRSVSVALQPFSNCFASIWLVTNHHICSIISPSLLGELPSLSLINGPDDE